MHEVVQHEEEVGAGGGGVESTRDTFEYSHRCRSDGLLGRCDVKY